MRTRVGVGLRKVDGEIWIVSENFPLMTEWKHGLGFMIGENKGMGMRILEDNYLLDNGYNG